MTEPAGTPDKWAPMEAAAAALARDVSSAMALRESFFQREMDASYLADGGHIFWAIDPAIMNAYFRNGKTPVNDPWGDYRVFSDPVDLDEGSKEYPSQLFDILIGMLIGQSGTKNSQHRGRLLLLPGHTTEAKNAYDCVVSGFHGATQSKKPQQRLVQFLDGLEAAQEKDRVSLTEANQHELHQILYGLYDAHQKFRTFSDALADRRILTVKGARFESEFEKLLPHTRALAEIVEGKRTTVGEDFPGSKKWWKDHLRPMSSLFADSDALALSALYELNKYLEPLQCRIVLVTDNPLIEKAGHQLVPEKYSDEGQSTPTIEEGLSTNTFSDLYVRRPRCFLSERDVLLPGSDQAGDVGMTGWLDAFLAKLNISGPMDLTAFRERAKRFQHEQQRLSSARHALARYPTIHSSLSTDWYRHVENVLLAHVSTSKEAVSRYVAQLSVNDRDRVDVLADFERIVSSLTEASWSEFFLSAAKSGYDLIGIAGDRSIGKMRNIPILYLRGNPEGENLLRLIYAPNGVIEHEAEIRIELEKLQTSTNDSDFYVAALCVCILFAYADRWGIASGLAARAAEIGNREMVRLENSQLDVARGSKIITGREANYLASVTRRLTARSEADLDQCQDYLDQSISAFNFEEEYILEKGIAYDGYPSITGLRIAAEKLAIDTARVFFKMHAMQWRASGDLGFQQAVRNNVRIAFDMVNGNSDCLSDEIRRNSEINLRLSLFSNWLLLEIEGLLEPEDTAHAAILVKQQLNDIFGDQQRSNSNAISPIDAYAILYAASFDSNLLGELTTSHPWASELTAVVEQRSPSLLMRFDQAKCKQMMKFVEGRKSAVSKGMHRLA